MYRAPSRRVWDAIFYAIFLYNSTAKTQSWGATKVTDDAQVKVVQPRYILFSGIIAGLFRIVSIMLYAVCRRLPRRTMNTYSRWQRCARYFVSGVSSLEVRSSAKPNKHTLRKNGGSEPDDQLMGYRITKRP